MTRNCFQSGKIPFIGKSLWIIALTVLTVAFVYAEESPANNDSESVERTVLEWSFNTPDSFDGWKIPGGISQAKVADGFLSGTFNTTDPMIFSPDFELATVPGQFIEIRYRCISRGSGELYFTETHEGAYNGFSSQKMNSWNLLGDGQWHTARVYPGWSNLSKIIAIRVDFGTPDTDQLKKARLEIDFIRLGQISLEQLPEYPDRWAKEELDSQWKLDSNENDFITLHAPAGMVDTNTRGQWLCLSLTPPEEETFATDNNIAVTGFNVTTSSPVRMKDIISASPESLNIKLSETPAWQGTLTALELTLPKTLVARLQGIALSPVPLGPGYLKYITLAPEEAIVRTGQSCTWFVRFRNLGEPLSNVQVQCDLPEGVKVLRWSLDDQPVDLNKLPTLDSDKVYSLAGVFESEVPCSTPPKLIFRTQEEAQENVLLTVAFDGFSITPSLNLAKAEYVPEPIPAVTDYELGSLYYPGWFQRSRWDRIDSSQPIRKPVLGWYDEKNPEVVDWQIKWAVESGINFFLVDWYWSRGQWHSDHWINAFYQSRYHHYLKWAVMWANHNGAGSHSEEDQRAVTQYWIDHYFKTPEYYTIDGKPVVMIWSPQGMDEDIRNIERQKGNELARGEGVKKLLDLSRQMVQGAGLPGIYFIAMKWPEDSTRPEDIQWLADAGFDCTSIYHFMGHNGKAGPSKQFSFDLVVDASRDYLERRKAAGILPFLPNLSTGWDDRPWNNNCSILDRTPAKFRQICQDLKAFCDQNEIKRIVTAPCNEWGEGSYIEPNAEFGFEMYNVLRETFCKEPEGGFPLNVTPSDVGLGPYDLPETTPSNE